MHFELMNAATTFKKIVDDVLCELLFIMVYVNGFLIFSKKLEGRIGHCKEVIRRNKEAKLILKVTKCSFAQLEVKWLGLIFNSGGVKVNADKIKGSVESPISANVTKLKSFFRAYGILPRDYKSVADILALLDAAKFVREHFKWTPKMR